MLYAQFRLLERQLEQGDPTDLQGLKAQGRLLEAAIVAHARAEDQILFEALSPAAEAAGPLAVMNYEHREIEGALQGLQAAPEAATAEQLLVDAIALCRDHFAKEEQVLFPLAERRLGDAELRRLGAEWAAARGFMAAV